MPNPVIFISHINEEARLAALIKERINLDFLSMFTIFVSSDGTSIEPGQRWLDTISTNLKAADAMLVLCSQASVKRSWINFEAGSGWVRDIPTIPICHTDMPRNRLPVPLSELQAIEGDKAEQWPAVYKVLARLRNSAMPGVDFSQLVDDIRAFEEEYRATLELNAQISPQNGAGNPLSPINTERLNNSTALLSDCRAAVIAWDLYSRYQAVLDGTLLVEQMMEARRQAPQRRNEEAEKLNRAKEGAWRSYNRLRMLGPVALVAAVSTLWNVYEDMLRSKLSNGSLDFARYRTTENNFIEAISAILNQ